MPITRSLSTAISDGASSGMFKNRIINGGMDVWQRGTSFTNSSYSGYTADRWWMVCSTASGLTVSRSTDVPTAQNQYSVKIQRPNGNTGTLALNLNQVIEGINCYDLAGKIVTLSFWAKSGANFSGGTFYGFVQSGTVADEGTANFYSWTNRQFLASSSITPTTTWTKYTFTTTALQSGTAEVGLGFQYTPTGTAGADDSLYITGVQLEVGTTATNFERRSYGHEFLLCQRYYEKFLTGFAGYISNGYAGGIATPLSVVKRASPTFTQSASLNASGFASGIGGLWVTGTNGVAVYHTATTTGNCSWVDEVIASAEL